MIGVVLVLLEDLALLVVIRVGEGLVDVDGAGRTGRPFAYEEILYGKGGYEPIVPGDEACSLWHDEGGKG